MSTARPDHQVAALAVVAVVLVGCGQAGVSASASAAASRTASTPAVEAIQSASPSASPHPFAGEDAWIAYQTNRGRESIWLIHPDGTDDHEVGLAVPGEHHHPDWSPDGNQLVISSYAAAEELYAVDVATDEARVLWHCSAPAAALMSRSRR